MKTILAAVLFFCAASTALASAAQSYSISARPEFSMGSDTLQRPEVKGRKGSTRSGGRNSHGKGSRYKGGRK
jgi:hypothetical protein